MEQVIGGGKTIAVFCITNSKGSGVPSSTFMVGGGRPKGNRFVVRVCSAEQWNASQAAAILMRCSASLTARVPVVPPSSTVKGGDLRVTGGKPQGNRFVVRVCSAEQWSGPQAAARPMQCSASPTARVPSSTVKGGGGRPQGDRFVVRVCSAEQWSGPQAAARPMQCSASPTARVPSSTVKEGGGRPQGDRFVVRVCSAEQ